jgi:spore germination protein KA
MIYLDGLPTDRVINEVRRRITQIQTDGVQDATELAEALADRRVSVFPTVFVTERPDTVAHFIKAGRVAIMMDNSPRALIVPALFVDFFSSPDDFYEWRPFVIFLRLLRFVAFNIAVPLPALYVSVTTYHLQALPTQLTLSLLAQREGAPLPPPIEAVIMTIMFEILREAGVRLPRAIGSTVSIVGGLVIGDAAIRSGLTSPAMVLVVSATAVATFSLPSTTLANAATYYRFFVLALASTFGFFGLLLGYLVALANLAGMTSLGIPYMTPLFPLRRKHMGTALGTTPRPPKGQGATPEPDMVIKADDHQERS